MGLVHRDARPLQGSGVGLLDVGQWTIKEWTLMFKPVGVCGRGVSCFQEVATNLETGGLVFAVSLSRPVTL